MKAWFLAVCLMNVLFFFWELHSGAFSPKVVPLTGKPAILLVSEREAARRGAEISAFLDRAVAEWQAKSVDAILANLTVVSGDFSQQLRRPATANGRKPKTETRHCYEFGPFADQVELQRWLVDNQVQTYQSIEKETTSPLDFQVYYPAAKNPEQVRINMLTLKAKGFADIWPVTDGDMKGAISLGVFNDKQRASLFKAQLAERGVTADIRRRTKTKIAMFVRVNAPLAAKDKSASQPPATECGRAQN